MDTGVDGPVSALARLQNVPEAEAYGVDAASRRFFGKPATELTLAEAAMLAGLPKAPSRSAPTESMERATARQHVVLAAMVDDPARVTPAQMGFAVNASTLGMAARWIGVGSV
mgnify:CR=1 FL=1